MNQTTRMLCVDDSAELRSALEEQFLNEDFVVDTAESGKAALEKISSADYDIVLLDISMPEMDGMAVLKEMKKIGRLPRVIMLSGYNDVRKALECVSLGAADYVSKPYDPEEVLTT